jgi:hypothetical protein
MNSIPRPARKRIRPRLSARSGRARQATRRSRSFVEHHIQVQHRDAGHALPVGVRARLRVLRRTRSAVLFHRQSGCGRDRNGRNERRRLCRRLVRPRFSSVSAERLIGRPPAQVDSALGTSPDPAKNAAPWRIYNIGNNSTVEVLELLERGFGRKAETEFVPMQPGYVTETMPMLTI